MRRRDLGLARPGVWPALIAAAVALAAAAGIASPFTALLHLLFLGGSLLIGAAATAAVVRAGRAGQFPRTVLEELCHGMRSLRAEVAPGSAEPLNRARGRLNVPGFLDSYFAFRCRRDLQSDAQPRPDFSVTADDQGPTTADLLRQQTSRYQELLRTLSDRRWRQSRVDQRAGALLVLAMPYVIALGWVTVPLAILSAVADQAPVAVALLPLLPAVAVLAMLSTELAELSKFCRPSHEHAPAREYRRLLVSLPGYEAVQGLAAARAVAFHPSTAPDSVDGPQAPGLVRSLQFVVLIAAGITVIDASLLAHLLLIDIPKIGRDSVLPLAVSLVLAGAASGAVVALCRSWRPPGWLVAVTHRVDDDEPTPTPSARHRLHWLPDRARTEDLLARWYGALQPQLVDGTAAARSGEDGESSRRFWRSALVLAVAASALCLTWARPGPWEAGVIIAAAVVVAIRRRRGLEAWSAVSAVGALARAPLRAARRRTPVALAERTWQELPPAARAILPLLLIQNVLIGLELGGAFGFLLIAALDLAVLNRLTGPVSRGRPTAPAVSNPVGSNGQPSGPGVEPAGGAAQRPGGDELEVSARAAPQADARPWLGAKLTGAIQGPIAVVALILATGWIAYAQPGPALIPVVLVVGLTIPTISNVDRGRAITMVLAVAVVIATVDYVSWRFVVTNWPGWWIAAPLLFAEAFGAVHVLGFQLTIWPWPQPHLQPTEDPTRRPIYIFIPTLNEGVAVLRPTLKGCIAARDRYVERHPGAQVTIVVCNDGRAAGAPVWEEVAGLARELGVSCVTRTQPGGAKAGNIENARQIVHATGNALVVIFDVDQVPTPDFLLKTVPPFADPKVGWVQTGQYYANLRNPVSRWADDQQSMFYNLLCPGKAAMNAAFICGTNVVLRASALDEIGGFPQDSVTEDFAASIRLHPRWRSTYLTDVLATGLGPLDIPSYFRQQGRWALGTLGVFRTHWREILLPRRNGLRIGQRAQYFLACTHYLCGLRDLIYVISPLLFIATGVPAVRSTSLMQYLSHFLPYAVLGLFAMWHAGRGVMGPRGIIMGFGSFPALLGSLLAVILNRKRGFASTSKKHGGQMSFRHLRVHLVLVLLCLLSLIWVTEVRGEQATSLFISVVWVLYSLALLGSFLWLALQDAGLATAIGKWGAPDEIASKLSYRSRLLARVDRGMPARNVAVAALVATPLLFANHLVGLPLFARPSVPAFVIGHEPVGPPYLGVSVPTRLLATRPALLE
ncbi:MAG: glycosyltransferase family 2 protein, partial [Candidatus Limnocylindria bacterium]